MKKEYIPFNDDYCVDIVGKVVIQKNTDITTLVLLSRSGQVYVYGAVLTWKELFDNFKFVDGSPCGISRG